jgi:phosphatidylinositol glycan class U
MSFRKNLALVISLGIVIRVAIYSIVSDHFVEYLSDRIEVLSIFTSYRRVAEGQFLFSEGMDPYSSNFLRLNPIVASVIFPLIKSKTLTFTFYVFCDTLSTILVALTADSYAVPVAAMVFLNPYTILSELGLSAQSTHILVMAALFFSVIKGKKTETATLWLALLVVLKPLVPIALVFPIALRLKRSVIRIIVSTIGWISVIVGLSYVVSGSSSFLGKSLWDPILITPDLEPNMGMAWCLFSMMFPGSLPLFRIFFHTHLFVFMFPAYLRFSKLNEPARNSRFLTLTMAAVIVFQLYPTCIDYSMFFAVMFACESRFHDKISILLTQTLLAGLAFTSVTGPLWIERNTGNGNFLFSLSIVMSFIGTLAVGHSLTVARLEGYVVEEQKSH